VLTHRNIVEKIAKPCAPPTNTGSFDCVRLAPHCAQDDSSNVSQMTRLCLPCEIAPRFCDWEAMRKQIPPASAALGVGMTRREGCGLGDARLAN